MYSSSHSATQQSTTCQTATSDVRTTNSEGLVKLGQYLQGAGYHHIAVSPLTHSYNNQRHGNARARNLRDVLGWSRAFERTAVSPEEFRLMDNAGILLPDGDLWRSSVRWASLGNLLCAHSAYPTHVEDAVFFGPDTYRFANLIRDYLNQIPQRTQNIKRAADIGCGSGAGALLIAEACPNAQILAADINPKALELTAINAALAGAPNIEPTHSNLLNDASGSFDLIVANPPYMLDTQKRAYRHGGGELGEGLAKDIVATALDRLAPGGTLLLYTGVAITNGQDPFLNALEHTLHEQPCDWFYHEMDPDVFSDELLKPAYTQVERIAAIAMTLTMHGS